MTALVAGVLGHVDHGKTALVRALTGMETDRLQEEKRRGISIALGFAHFALGEVGVDLIDMPGHERFVRTAIAGATGIDAALLVVAANEGIKPQTREHVDIAGLLGLRRAIVAVSKADLASPEDVGRVLREAAALAARAGLQVQAAVATSAAGGVGIAALRAALAGLAAGREPPEAGGIAYLPIDRAFSVAGHGTVVTGTLRGAPLAPNDALELLPGQRPVRVRALQVHGMPVARAEPGQRVAANLRGVEAKQVPRGAALAPAGALPPSAWLTVQLRAVDGAAPLRTGLELQVLLGTAEVPARLRLLDRDVLDAGQTAPAQLRLATPLSVPAREHLILRLPSPARTVAGGRIVEAETTRHRRHAPAVLERLRALAEAAPDEMICQEVARTGAAGTSVQRLARLTGLAPGRVAEMLQGMPALIGRNGTVAARAAVEALGARVLAVLRERGATGPERLAAALPEAGPGVIEATMARLIATGVVRKASGAFDVPRKAADEARARAEAGIAHALAEALRQGGLTPPDAAACGPEAGRILARLVRAGLVVRAHDSGQKRDVLFHRDAILHARRSLLPLLAAPPGLLVSEIGAALGISRKFSVPLLEHLDATGFTRRLGDRRVLATPRGGP